MIHKYVENEGEEKMKSQYLSSVHVVNVVYYLNEHNTSIKELIIS